MTVAQKIADITRDPELQRLCNNKMIRWEDIRTLEYAGKEHVYDLEIKNAHNFVANNIISHKLINQNWI